MGKYMRKCNGAKGDVALIEVTQTVGVRTRSRALKAAAMAKVKKEAEVELEGYLELRSRRLFMAPRMTRLASSRGRISRCSRNGALAVVKLEEETSERLHLPSDDTEVTNDVEGSAVDSEYRRERKDATASSEARGEIMSDLESEAGEKEKQTSSSNNRSNQDKTKMASQSELDEFFCAAEKTQRDRFASKYNFDVEKERPLEGRYEWVQLNC